MELARGASDGSGALFSGVARLPPGRHAVKLRVDGAWRLAPGWPIEVGAGGAENNVLTVE